MNKKISAGLLMYRGRGEQLEVFLVHPGGPYWQNKDEGTWSLPKGEKDEHEDDLLAVAKREFEEETGTKPASDTFIELGSIVQKSGKTVHAWAFAGELTAPFSCNTCFIEWPPKSGKQLEIPEADRGEFFDPETAKKKIVGGQVAFINRLMEAIDNN